MSCTACFGQSASALSCGHRLCQACASLTRVQTPLEVTVLCHLCLKKQLWSKPRAPRSKGEQNKQSPFPKQQLDQTLFCFDCESGVFGAKQAAKGAHATHRVETLREGQSILKERLEQGLKQLIYKGSFIRNKLKESKYLAKQVQADYNQTVSSVQGFFTKLRDSLLDLQTGFVEKVRLQQKTVTDQLALVSERLGRELARVEAAAEGARERLRGEICGQSYHFYVRHKNFFADRGVQPRLSDLKTKAPTFVADLKTAEKVLSQVVSLEPRVRESEEEREPSAKITSKVRELFRRPGRDQVWA